MLEHRHQGGRKGGEPVGVALARTDGQSLHLLIDVLDPEPDCFPFGGEKIFTRPHAVETNAPYNPLHLGSLGVHGVVGETAHLADVIKEY